MNDYNKIHENVSQGIDKEALDQLCNKLGLAEGGDLAKILNALAENSGGGGASIILTCDLGDNYGVHLEGVTKAEIANALSITENDIDRILNMELYGITVISRKNGDERKDFAIIDASEIPTIGFYSGSCSLELLYDSGVYNLNCSVIWPR